MLHFMHISVDLRWISFVYLQELAAAMIHGLLVIAQVRNNLFDDAVSLLLKNGDRYNLLNSALLDLFEYIRRENLKSLLEHVVSYFRKLQPSSVPCFPVPNPVFFFCMEANVATTVTRVGR